MSPHGTLGNSFWGQNVVFGVWIRYHKHFTLDDPKSRDLILNPRKRRVMAESLRNTLEANGVNVEGITDEASNVLDIYIGPRFPPDVDDQQATNKRSLATAHD